MPDESQLAQQWKSFDESKRSRILARMSPEQKKKLRGMLETTSSASSPSSTKATSAKSSTPADWRAKLDAQMAPDDASSLDYLPDVINEFGKGAAAATVGAVIHPIQTVKGIGQMVAHPVDTVTQMGEQFQQNPAYVMGNLVGGGLITHAVNPGGLVAGATRAALSPVEALTGISDAASDTARSAAQKMIGAGTRAVVDKASKIGEDAEKDAQDVKTKRLKTAGEAREMVKKHQQETEEARTENAKILKQHNDQVARQQQIKAESEKLDRKYKAAEKKAKSDNDAQWDRVRIKTEGATTDLGVLKAVTGAAAKQADPATSNLFGSILREDVEDARPVHVNGGILPETNQHWAQLYEMEYGEPPPVVGIEGTTSFDRLQRWYSYVNDRMYSGGRLEPGTYNALKMVRNALNDAMQKIADDTGASEDLRKARESHTHMMEAFYDSPNEPATVASKSLSETTPEHMKELARQERLKKVARYDKSIPAHAQYIRDLHRGAQALGKETNLGKKLAPLPENPALPKRPTFEPAEVDPRAIREDIIKKAAARWRDTSQYQIRRIVATGIGAMVYALGGHNPFEAALGYTAAELSPKMLASLVDKPRVLEWLSKPSAEDIKAIRSIPYQDRIRIVGALNEIVQEQKASGKPLKLNAATQALLSGAAGPAAVVRSRKQAMDALRAHITPHPENAPTPGSPDMSKAKKPGPNGSTHVFNVEQWKAHPENAGADVNEAIEEARRQGYQVVQ